MRDLETTKMVYKLPNGYITLSYEYWYICTQTNANSYPMVDCEE